MADVETPFDTWTDDTPVFDDWDVAEAEREDREAVAAWLSREYGPE